MNLSRLGILLGATAFLLFCLGFGWGPAASSPAPQELALIGLTAAGLLWPALVLGMAARNRGGGNGRVAD